MSIKRRDIILTMYNDLDMFFNNESVIDRIFMKDRIDVKAYEGEISI